MQVLPSMGRHYFLQRCVHRYSHHRPTEVLEASMRTQRSLHRQPKARTRPLQRLHSKPRLHRGMAVMGLFLHVLLPVRQLRPHRDRQMMRQPG